MLAYWCLFIVFAAGALLSKPYLPQLRALGTGGDGRPPQHEFQPATPPLLIAAAIIPTILIGFRYRVGADWIPYELIFYDISYMDLRNALFASDPAYGFLNWAVASTGTDIWAVNLICGAIFCFGLVRFAAWQPNAWLTVLVAIPYLVIGVGMGYSRQAVAIGLALCALTSVKNGSIVRFILWMIAASLFHRSAIILVPIVALSYTRSRLQALVLGAITALGGWFLLVEPAMHKVNVGYLDPAYEAQGAGVRLAMNVVPALIFLAFSRKFGLDPAQRVIWRNMSFVALGAIVAYFLVASSVVVDRLALYVIPIQLLVYSRLPYLGWGERKGSPIILLLVVFYSALVQFVWLNYANHAQYWVPYQFFPVGEDRVPVWRE